MLPIIVIASVLTFLIEWRQYSRLRACSSTPATDVLNTTFALYWYARILALGRHSGRRSLSQCVLDSLSVQVFSAWSSRPVRFMPWTATILIKISIEPTHWLGGRGEDGNILQVCVVGVADGL